MSEGARAPLPSAEGYRERLDPIARSVDVGSAGSAARGALASTISSLVDACPRLLADADPEIVHYSRVAVRRLRANLASFATLLPRGRATALRSELRWLGRRLGVVRDADILAARLRRDERDLAEGDSAVVRKLLATSAKAREEGLVNVAKALSSARGSVLLQGLVDVAATPSGASTASREAAAPSFARIMDSQWRRTQRAFRDLGEDSADPELHAARIATKRSRYAAEAMVPVFGDPCRMFVRRCKEVQDVLGEYQDAVVATAWLRRAARRASPDVAFVAGRIAAAEDRSRAAARSAWPSAWSRLDREERRFW